MRLFFAAWPPLESARALERWARALEGRVTPADKIHLTLAFLGVVAPEKAILAARRVQGKPHQIPLETASYWKHNKIIWAGPRQTPAALKALVDGLHYELCRAEYILERRPFAAHVTLLRAASPPPVLAPLPQVDWPVEEFVLVNSSTSAKGSSYDIVERFPVRQSL